MTFARFSVASILLLVSILFATTVAQPNTLPEHFAARCVYQSSRCTADNAARSVVCRPNLLAEDQSFVCKREACSWCRLYKPLYKFWPCGGAEIREICLNIGFRRPDSSPTIAPTPTPKTAPPQGPTGTVPGGCVWTGSGAGSSVVIDLGRVKQTPYWPYVYRDGRKGIIYRNGPKGGISKPGVFGVKCFEVSAPKSGKYYFSAISYSPHNTEHNDMWVRSDKGFELWKWKSRPRYANGFQWLKAYQNYGRRGISDDLKTIDFNGHRFIIPNVLAWKKFRICISGRSKLYEIYKLVLVRCEGDYCRGRIIHDLDNLRTSNCNLPARTPTPTPTPRAAPQGCVWTGSGAGSSVVIDLSKVGPTQYWHRTSRNGFTGIIYRNGPIHGISRPGVYGEMCFDIRAPLSGKYYFSAISYAPHNTEHNDVWVRSSKGFELWKWGKRGPDASSTKWLKAYQNWGKRGISDDLKTIDFNGHRFLVPNVVKWKKFQICISGRSKLFELYRLVLVKCEGFSCEGGILEGLKKLRPSNCRI